MVGHRVKKTTKSKSKDGSNHNDNSGNIRREDGPKQQSQIDIDELATKKVSEIEAVLDQSKEKGTWDASLPVLKQIITAADLHRTNDKNENSSNIPVKCQDGGESIYADYADDNEQFNAHIDLTEQFATNSVKWTIRVRAFKLIHKLVDVSAEIGADPNHFALKHLSDLIRLSFVAATSPYDELKMQGFDMFLKLIEKLSFVEEKEFRGHSILEQYKTQILSAIKPAFDSDAPPYITAIASRICSLWICKGLEKDPVDVRRTHQLMLLSIGKLESQSINQNSKLYTESELEQERLGILDSWAQLYLASREVELKAHPRTFQLSTEQCLSLHSLVEPHIENLVDKWWEALKDYALLIMPAPRLAETSPHDNGNVYTREVALRLFEPTWPKLILATTLWLCLGSNKPLEHISKVEETVPSSSDCDIDSKDSPELVSPKRSTRVKYTKFTSGIIMKELYRLHTSNANSTKLPDSTLCAIRAFHLILSTQQTRPVIVNDMQIAKEFYTILYEIAASHGRDPSRTFLVGTLDLMLSILVQEALNNSDVASIRFGAVKLVSQVLRAMKDTEILVKHERNNCDKIDEARMHLSIRLSSLLLLIRRASGHILGEVELMEAILMLFQEALCLESEPSFIITASEKLTELYPMIPEVNRAHFICGIMEKISARTSEVFERLYCGSKDIAKGDLAIWNAYMKCMQVAAQQSNDENKTELVEKYIGCCTGSIDFREESIESKRKIELVGITANHLTALTKSLGETTIASINDETRVNLEALMKLHNNLTAKKEEKSNKRATTNPKDKLATASAKPPRKKIELKLDFSDFYSKKN